MGSPTPAPDLQHRDPHVQFRCGAVDAERVAVNRTLTNNLPAASLPDPIPRVNILPFGLRQSMANPTAAAATAAALDASWPLAWRRR